MTSRNVVVRLLQNVAAIRGNVGAMLNVANIYSSGAQGVPQDYISASRWLESAAERGNAIAIFNVGYLYCPRKQKIRRKLLAAAAALSLKSP